MINLLRDLRQQVSSSGQNRIDDLLSAVVENAADAAAFVQQHPADGRHKPSIGEERGEANINANAGSFADLDPPDEILRTEEAEAAGFIQYSSKAPSLQDMLVQDVSNQVKENAWGPQGDDNKEEDKRPTVPREGHDSHLAPPLHTSQANFYLDDEILETDPIVNPLEMPQFEIASRLVVVYMENVHNSFPLLSKKAFFSCFYQYYTSLQRGIPCSMDRKWQAVLNLVFAIGAMYSHLTLADWRADERDYQLYHSRACLLSLEDSWWVSHPSFPHMQITALLSFYYLSIGHINRSWTLIGVAIRSGIALGMHIPNEGRHADTTEHEIMSGIWWALYALEQHVSALTERPSLAIGDLCSIPHPFPLFPEDIEGSIIEPRLGEREKGFLPSRATVSPGVVDLSARQDRYPHVTSSRPAKYGSYLHSVVSLGEITQGALALYSAKTASGPWDFVQRMIAQRNNELDSWASFFRKASTSSMGQVSLGISVDVSKTLLTSCIKVQRF
ncbi:hypothetical protein EKO04_002894 [Ascochyta lentis]|uniref:Xylanolytic transcriptional activator regulatory domain-containing protein n=1 Tax=Ascochyta lentis TaxID=205686 RepID=A0A8H7JB99_9PLEO|nr:hypothetical protein EKO04_002894 [Ascochyta lentis]